MHHPKEDRIELDKFIKTPHLFKKYLDSEELQPLTLPLLKKIEEKG